MFSNNWPHDDIAELRQRILSVCIILKRTCSRFGWFSGPERSEGCRYSGVPSLTLAPLHMACASSDLWCHCHPGPPSRRYFCLASYIYQKLLHSNANPIYLFLFWELRGLSPCFHIHVYVSDLYMYSQNRSTYFLQRNRLIDPGNIQYKSLTDTLMWPHNSFSKNIWF